MALIFDALGVPKSWQQTAGQFIENVGDFIGKPEGQWSETIAGGPTQNTYGQTYAYTPTAQPQMTSANMSYASPTDLNRTSTSNLDQSYFNNNPDPVDLARKEAADREAALRGSISSQWDGVFNYLDNVRSGLGGQLSEQQNRVSGMYNNQLQNLGSERDAATKRLEGFRGDARENQAQSLRSLAENFRNSLRAGQAFLGGMGAGDSSAVGRMTGALAKSANRTQGQIATQTNKIFADINMREDEVKRIYETEKRNLDTWKNDKLIELSSWYNDAKNALDAQRATAQGQRAEALAQLDQQLYSHALNRLSQIESQTNQWGRAVDSWATQRMQQLDAVKQQIVGQTQGVDTSNLPGTFDRTMAMGPGNLGRGNAPIGYGASSEEDQLSRLA